MKMNERKKEIVFDLPSLNSASLQA